MSHDDKSFRGSLVLDFRILMTSRENDLTTKKPSYHELCHVTSHLVMSTHTPNVFQMISRVLHYFSKYKNTQTKQKMKHSPLIQFVANKLIDTELERVYTSDT